MGVAGALIADRTPGPGGTPHVVGQSLFAVAGMIRLGGDEQRKERENGGGGDHGLVLDPWEEPETGFVPGIFITREGAKKLPET